MIEPTIYNQKPKTPQNTQCVDAYESGLKELFFIKNPRFKKEMPEAEEILNKFLKTNKIKPVWIYYPWRKIIIKSLPEKYYFELRTARNKNVIEKKEQINYRNLKVGIVGLSVGSAIVHAIVTSGGPKNLKIADFDTLEVSNLNRIKAKLTDFGQNKTHIAAHEVWELDPFAKLALWDQGINNKNINQFLLKPKLDVFIDEMDSLDLKIKARKICQKNKIPVLMATDNGDGVILDVERFDIEPNRKLFHGLASDIENENVSNLDFKRWVNIATKIVGPSYLTKSMKNSLKEIGKTIAAVPQLGTSALMAGSAISYALRMIASKKNLKSGRYIISLEKNIK
ncbi:MAG: hypothetical protein COV29_03775 [Candidatus Yanofskybacteria bacterium CG10_big_fil_rev_8_21_14_0_10_36_16]|uniref:THIF-type NAD/FAD binding fold domain-containing protein n=1 Tax=Candidatus Yanofskybacteria bacterium CG10_big_fil_rev_8_21_14_0_10_36_16 TaxID=1975096 RepID=A0A2J0Q6X9_9BACT|nr:MAG: hypothetical protein COV29_03775 [Candidatus Yanofskybacteria bacterium CG10_big_fil_rev_8_21_14_0_10_36_16]